MRLNAFAAAPDCHPIVRISQGLVSDVVRGDPDVLAGSARTREWARSKTRNPKQEIQNKKPKTRNPKQETQNKKPKTRNKEGRGLAEMRGIVRNPVR